MNHPQIITTPGGEEMVILPRAEYEALLTAAEEAAEDAADIAVYDARMADLAAGRDEPLPAPVSQSILRGDSLLKALRRWRGMTQQDLAAKTGLAQGYISDLEARRRKGSDAALKQLAAALDVKAAWLVA